MIDFYSYAPEIFILALILVSITFGILNKGLTITIPFKKGTEKIEIFGSYVVPEFGQMVMIVLAVTIIGIVIISRKTNSFSNLFYTKMWV